MDIEHGELELDLIERSATIMNWMRAELLSGLRRVMVRGLVGIHS